jgi:hypothetical protein
LDSLHRQYFHATPFERLFSDHAEHPALATFVRYMAAV